MIISTRFQKSIKEPSEASNCLKPGSNNKKLGYNVTSNRWKGKKLYSLTLVERETCPTSCHHWVDCYGNNMPFAHRYSTDNLEDKLEQELATLIEKQPNGIVVRLHVLGDFYSVSYVKFWEEMLFKHPKLCLFGYTGREEFTTIGQRIQLLNSRFNERCVIRYSRSKEYTKGNLYAAEESFEGNSFDCPEQTGKVKSCAACGLCWTTTKTVRFLSH
jgi:hypothetical protein